MFVGKTEGNPPFSQGNGRSKIWDPTGSPILVMEGENDEKIKELRSKIAILKAVEEAFRSRTAMICTQSL